MTAAFDQETVGALAREPLVVLDAAMSPRAALKALGHGAAAVVQAGGRPVGVCSREQLREAAGASPHTSGAVGDTASPAVFVPARLRLADIQHTDVVTLLALSPYAVVMDRGDIIGVTTRATITDALAAYDMITAARGVFTAEAEPSDALLAGSPKLPFAMVRCRRPGCGHTSRLAFYDPRHPPRCGHPELPDHALVVEAD